MNPNEITFSTAHNAFLTPDSICEECDAPATIFADAIDDEFCTCLCATHAIELASAFLADLPSSHEGG